LDFYETKMQSWKETKDISNMKYFTKTALEFSSIFASSKSDQINEFLRSLKK